MESSWEETKSMAEHPLLEDQDQQSNQKGGGFTTLPFIIGNDSFEKMATFGLAPNMPLYLMEEYHLGMTASSNVLFMWSSVSSFTPLVGAILADSFFGRFCTIGAGSIICLLGLILLWSTTAIPAVKPAPCIQSISGCASPTAYQFVYLCASFVLISIGAGGIRSSSLAFGANQLGKGNGTGLKMERYFSWYYASYALSVIFSLTCLVYIQDHFGWGIGYAVPVAFMFVGVTSFFLASTLYVKVKSESSLVTGLVQVCVASYRNRQLKLSDSSDCVWHCKNGSDLVSPSQNIRFLNKACVVTDPSKDLTTDERAKDPWSLCTVDQVEDLKAVIRIIPIWSTGMIMSVNISQGSFPVVQAANMDRHITSSITIPAASLSTFTVVAVILWIVMYDRIFLPLASRIAKRPVRISTLQRMGLGIFLSFLAMTVSAMVESARRYLATHEGHSDRPTANLHMSAMWLVPQYCLTGFAEASNVIAQNEFYFSELPRSMSSVALTLNALGASLASLIASFAMNSIDKLSKADGKESWISSDINKGHYDYYYLVLAGLSIVNMICFLVCSRAYGPLKEERKVGEHEDD